MLTPAQKKRFAQLCGMLGSDQEGERANAAMFATKLLIAAGYTWEQFGDAAFKVIDGGGSQQEQPKANRKQQKPTDDDRVYTKKDEHVEDAEWCLEYEKYLSRWEREFLDSIINQSYLSQKQQDILNKIKSRLEGFTRRR